MVFVMDWFWAEHIIYSSAFQLNRNTNAGYITFFSSKTRNVMIKKKKGSKQVYANMHIIFQVHNKYHNHYG